MSLQSHPSKKNNDFLLEFYYNLFPLFDNRTAAEWHAFEICKVSSISEKKKKALWNGLSEKRRKKLEMEHTKRLEEYEEKLQAFKKVAYTLFMLL